MGHDSDRVVNKKKHHVESCWVDAVYSESATHHIYIYIRLNLGPRSQERPKDHEDRVARAPGPPARAGGSHGEWPRSARCLWRCRQVMRVVFLCTSFWLFLHVMPFLIDNVLHYLKVGVIPRLQQYCGWEKISGSSFLLGKLSSIPRGDVETSACPVFSMLAVWWTGQDIEGWRPAPAADLHV